MTTRFSSVEMALDFWQIIKIGGMPKKALLESVEADGWYAIGKRARFVIEQRPEFTTLPTMKNLKLGHCPIEAFGFTEEDPPTPDLILSRIIEVGYEPCPAEVALRLCLIVKDQQKGTTCLSVMTPIPGFGDRQTILGLQRDLDGRRVLTGWDAELKHLWRNPHASVVFVIPS